MLSVKTKVQKLIDLEFQAYLPVLLDLPHDSLGCGMADYVYEILYQNRCEA